MNKTSTWLKEHRTIVTSLHELRKLSNKNPELERLLDRVYTNLVDAHQEYTSSDYCPPVDPEEG